MKYIRSAAVFVFLLFLVVKDAVSEHSEQIKHVTDAIIVPAGIGASVAWWMAELVNPFLTGLVLLTTVVWTVYRIIDIRDKRRQRKIDEKIFEDMNND